LNRYERQEGKVFAVFAPHPQFLKCNWALIFVHIYANVFHGLPSPFADWTALMVCEVSYATTHLEVGCFISSIH
jgi:hypothetical protein